MKNYTPARQELVEAGWTRRDRNRQEFWQPPWDGIGMRPDLVTFSTARRRLRDYKRTTK